MESNILVYNHCFYSRNIEKQHLVNLIHFQNQLIKKKSVNVLAVCSQPVISFMVISRTTSFIVRVLLTLDTLFSSDSRTSFQASEILLEGNLAVADGLN